MKNPVVLGILTLVVIASCTQEKGTNDVEEVSSPVNELVFDVSANHNIASFNIYHNDKLAMQLSSSTLDTFTQYKTVLEGLDISSYNVLDVEPIFLDSASADVSVKMSFYSDGNLITTAEDESVLWGEVASVSVGE